MDNGDQKTCETYLLDDIPAPADAFASDGDAGPHQRVADAIADMIESAEVGGKAIGLEGGWGSGKSTLVRFLADRFSNQNNYTVVLFDAWAHEGDPLRRTFIESIVHELCDYGWANKDAWGPKLEELANRRKETTTKITPKPTKLGKVMAISLLLVPIGSAFIAGGFREGVTFGWGNPPNWFFCVGLLLALSPFWVLALRWLQLCKKRRSTGGSGEQQAASSKSKDEDDSSSDWAFLLSRAINETHTETIETPNPTSLEFDDHFGKLMAESLSDDSRRLLLVLDNLDRVDADTALSIWSTLQTFLHDRDHDSEQWYKRLWVIVPYDPIRIRRLWNQPEEHGLDGDDEPESTSSEAIRTTESFLDKSFQVRFHVAPPVLSDWKSFLYDLVAKALPGHVKDQHLIYRVFDHCRARGGDPPTPRELKLYVNQIGAVHRQWQHEFPIGHIAFFVLARKAHHRLIDKLREGNVPTQDDRRLLDDETPDHDLKSSLAGLAFNAKASKGLELLLAESITDALKRSDTSELTAIAKRNGSGFWAVLEIVATSRWHSEDTSGIAAVSSRLRDSKLLDDYTGPEKSEVLKALRDAAMGLNTWMPVSDEIAAGVSDLFCLQNDQDFTGTILRKVCTQIAKEDTSREGDPDAGVFVGSLFKIFDTAKRLGHTNSIPRTVTLPFKGEDWIAACEDIARRDKEAAYWGRLRPSGKFDEVSASLVSTISSGDFSDSQTVALTVTQRSSMQCDWQEVCTAIQTRLGAGQAASTNETTQLLCALFQLQSLGVQEAIASQKALSEPGHLVHHFHRAKSEDDATGQAAIIFSIASHRPKFGKPTAVGDSDAGHPMLTKAVASPEEDVASELYQLGKRFGMLPKLLSIIDAAGTYHPLFVEVLKLVADSEAPQDVFSSEVVIQRWSDLRKHLPDDSNKSRFQELVGRLAQTNQLCEAIQGSDEAFNLTDSSLYRYVLLGAKGSVPEFVEWCRDGLRRLNEDDWKSELGGASALCIVLSEQEHAPSLSNSFSDAIQDNAKSVVNGKDVPPAVILEKWRTVLDCIEETSTRKVLRERLIETAVDADGSLADEFFVMYGAEIAEPTMLAANDRVLSHFFTALVREKHIRGLAWLDEFATEHPKFLEAVSAEHTVKDFTDRLQNLVDEPSDHESQVTIESIAAHFGIEPTPKPEDTGEESEASEQETPKAEE